MKIWMKAKFYYEDVKLDEILGELFNSMKLNKTYKKYNNELRENIYRDLTMINITITKTITRVIQ